MGIARRERKQRSRFWTFFFVIAKTVQASRSVTGQMEGMAWPDAVSACLLPGCAFNWLRAMKVLVIGSGGREHALTWKLKQSPGVDQIFCAPGNAGTGAIAENVAIAATDLVQLVQFAKQNDVDLTVVGPDDPLEIGR